MIVATVGTVVTVVTVVTIVTEVKFKFFSAVKLKLWQNLKTLILTKLKN